MADQILLGVTGSIAACKSVEVLRLMQGKGWEVSVVMTRAATEFVGELTLRTLSRRPVAVDMFARREEWCPQHVSLADRADLFVIAPCTANVMAKLAHGLADDMLCCTALACRAPLLLAPAMNEKMWDHPATRQNVETLRARGVRFVDVGSGDLACGYQGRGRMAAPDVIVRAAEESLAER